MGKGGRGGGGVVDTTGPSPNFSEGQESARVCKTTRQENGSSTSVGGRPNGHFVPYFSMRRPG